MKILFLLAFVFVTNLSSAGTWAIADGDSLSQGLNLLDKAESGNASLTKDEQLKAVAAASYIQGFFGACGIWDVWTSKPPFRFPKEGVSYYQFRKVVTKYLNDHPDRLHVQPFEGLVYLALRDAFPNPEYNYPEHRE